jgi:hypothetical protein
VTFPAVELDAVRPVDIVDELTLGVGRNYGAQYQGPGVVALRESDSAIVPDLDQAASYAKYAALRLTPKSGEGIWAWVSGCPARLAEGARIVVWEE